MPIPFRAKVLLVTLTTPVAWLLKTGEKLLVKFRFLFSVPALLNVPTPMMWLLLSAGLRLNTPPTLLLNSAVPPVSVSSIWKRDSPTPLGVKVTVP